jgi:hypothetical protein
VSEKYTKIEFIKKSAFTLDTAGRSTKIVFVSLKANFLAPPPLEKYPEEVRACAELEGT